VNIFSVDTGSASATAEELRHQHMNIIQIIVSVIYIVPNSAYLVSFC
jgi:hypothetical protein